MPNVRNTSKHKVAQTYVPGTPPSTSSTPTKVGVQQQKNNKPTTPDNAEYSVTPERWAHQRGIHRLARNNGVNFAPKKP